MAMNEWSANNSARADQVWQRLVGCYGDSLIRKFDEAPPPEWRSAIGELNDYQLQQGMRRLKYSGKPHPPSLPEFVKLCRAIGHSDDIPDARPPQQLPALPHDGLDQWAVAANLHFLGYITRRISVEPRCFGDPGTPKHTAAIGELVRHKNAWAENMREWKLDRVTGEVEEFSADEQKETWNFLMKQAELAVSALFAAYA